MEKLKKVVQQLGTKGIDAVIENGTVYVVINDCKLELSEYEINYQYEQSQIDVTDFDFTLEVGDTVLVGEPRYDDLYQHSFMGEVTNIDLNQGICTVVDGEGDYFDVDLNNVEKQDDE